MKPQSPCFGCDPPKRTITCKFDGTCEKYAPFEKQIAEWRAEAEKRAKDKQESIEYTKASMKRMHRKVRVEGV